MAREASHVAFFLYLKLEKLLQDGDCESEVTIESMQIIFWCQKEVFQERLSRILERCTCATYIDSKSQMNTRFLSLLDLIIDGPPSEAISSKEDLPSLSIIQIMIRNKVDAVLARSEREKSKYEERSDLRHRFLSTCIPAIIENEEYTWEILSHSKSMLASSQLSVRKSGALLSCLVLAESAFGGLPAGIIRKAAKTAFDGGCQDPEVFFFVAARMLPVVDDLLSTSASWSSATSSPDESHLITSMLMWRDLIGSTFFPTEKTAARENNKLVFLLGCPTGAPVRLALKLLLLKKTSSFEWAARFPLSSAELAIRDLATGVAPGLAEEGQLVGFLEAVLFELLQFPELEPVLFRPEMNLDQKPVHVHFGAREGGMPGSSNMDEVDWVAQLARRHTSICHQNSNSNSNSNLNRRGCLPVGALLLSELAAGRIRDRQLALPFARLAKRHLSRPQPDQAAQAGSAETKFGELFLLRAALKILFSQCLAATSPDLTLEAEILTLISEAMAASFQCSEPGQSSGLNSSISKFAGILRELPELERLAPERGPSNPTATLGTFLLVVCTRMKARFDEEGDSFVAGGLEHYLSFFETLLPAMGKFQESAQSQTFPSPPPSKSRTGQPEKKTLPCRVQFPHLSVAALEILEASKTARPKVAGRLLALCLACGPPQWARGLGKHLLTSAMMSAEPSGKTDAVLRFVRSEFSSFLEGLTAGLGSPLEKNLACELFAAFAGFVVGAFGALGTRGKWEETAGKREAVELVVEISTMVVQWGLKIVETMQSESGGDTWRVCGLCGRESLLAHLEGVYGMGRALEGVQVAARYWKFWEEFCLFELELEGLAGAETGVEFGRFLVIVRKEGLRRRRAMFGPRTFPEVSSSPKKTPLSRKRGGRAKQLALSGNPYVDAVLLEGSRKGPRVSTREMADLADFVVCKRGRDYRAILNPP